MILECIAKLVDGGDLFEAEAEGVMGALMEGAASEAQIGALLTALRMKGETVEEITGFARAMRAKATRVETSRRPLVDTCGTGGDGSGTFNISTTAAFVVAGAGVAVAKHGNRRASSRCGSADVLECLGVNIEANAACVGRCIDDVGIGFLFARNLHGAMKHVAKPRQELKMRTVFNVLGPLTNPAGACGQVMGVFDGELVAPLARVLGNLGTRHAFVVAGEDGLDEVSISGPTKVSEFHGGQVKSYEVCPEEFGIETGDTASLAGGDEKENAEILRAVLEGEKGPRRDVVVLNAAPAIVAGEGAEDWKGGIEAARESLDSGSAKAALVGLIEASHDS